MTFTHILHRIVSSLTQSYSYVQTVTTIQINDHIQRKGTVVGRCHILQNVTIVTPGYCGSNKLYRRDSLEVVVINLGLRKTIVKRPKTVHLESVETNNSSPHTHKHTFALKIVSDFQSTKQIMYGEIHPLLVSLLLLLNHAKISTVYYERCTCDESH
jgi:hypothetical protein